MDILAVISHLEAVEDCKILIRYLDLNVINEILEDFVVMVVVILSIMVKDYAGDEQVLIILLVLIAMVVVTAKMEVAVTIDNNLDIITAVIGNIDPTAVMDTAFILVKITDIVEIGEIALAIIAVIFTVPDVASAVVHNVLLKRGMAEII